MELKYHYFQIDVAPVAEHMSSVQERERKLKKLTEDFQWGLHNEPHETQRYAHLLGNKMHEEQKAIRSRKEIIWDWSQGSFFTIWYTVAIYDFETGKWLSRE